MKKRLGFVSNSSSSSFLVVFPKIPESVEETEQIMYSKANTNLLSDPIFRRKSAEYVFKDIQEQESNNILDALAHTSQDLYFDKEEGLYCYYNFIYKTIEELENAIEEYYNKEKEMNNFDWEQENADEKYNELNEYIDDRYFIDNLKVEYENIKYLMKSGGYLFNFTYSDEFGIFFSNMEHGDIFQNLPHEKYSFH